MPKTPALIDRRRVMGALRRAGATPPPATLPPATPPTGPDGRQRRALNEALLRGGQGGASLRYPAVADPREAPEIARLVISGVDRPAHTVTGSADMSDEEFIALVRSNGFTNPIVVRAVAAPAQTIERSRRGRR